MQAVPFAAFGGHGDLGVRWSRGTETTADDERDTAGEEADATFEVVQAHDHFAWHR